MILSSGNLVVAGRSLLIWLGGGSILDAWTTVYYYHTCSSLVLSGVVELVRFKTRGDRPPRRYKY